MAEITINKQPAEITISGSGEVLTVRNDSVNLVSVNQRGLTGAKGDKGDTGETGAQGLKGDKGDTGATGAQGIQGIQGERGLQGEQGIQGIQGVQGLQGLKGDTGDAGAAGQAAPQQVFIGQNEPTTTATAIWFVTDSNGVIQDMALQSGV